MSLQFSGPRVAVNAKTRAQPKIVGTRCFFKSQMVKFNRILFWIKSYIRNTFARVGSGTPRPVFALWLNQDLNLTSIQKLKWKRQNIKSAELNRVGSGTQRPVFALAPLRLSSPAPQVFHCFPIILNLDHFSADRCFNWRYIVPLWWNIR